MVPFRIQLMPTPINSVKADLALLGIERDAMFSTPFKHQAQVV